MTATTDDRPRVVVDFRTGETVFGPATSAQVSHWIMQEGFWRGADLHIDVAGADGEPAVCGWKPLPGYVHYAHAGCPGAVLDARGDR